MGKNSILLSTILVLFVVSGCMLMENLSSSIASSATGGKLVIYSETQPNSLRLDIDYSTNASQIFFFTETNHVLTNDGTRCLYIMPNSGQSWKIDFVFKPTGSSVSLSRLSNGYINFTVNGNLAALHAGFGDSNTSVYMTVTNLPPSITTNLKLPVSGMINANAVLNLSRCSIPFSIKGNPETATYFFIDNIFWSQN